MKPFSNHQTAKIKQMIKEQVKQIVQKVVNTEHVSLSSPGGTYTDILPNYAKLQNA